MKRYFIVLILILTVFSCERKKDFEIIKPVQTNYPFVNGLHFADKNQEPEVDSLINKIRKILNEDFDHTDKRPVMFDYVLYVNPNGKIEKIVVLESLSDKVDNLVAQTVKKWKLQPLLEKKPIGSRTELKFGFVKSGDKYKLFIDYRNPLMRYVNLPNDTYQISAEQMPEPVGGLKAIQEKVVYPELARKAGIEGRVFVKAYINEKGIVEKTEILKGIGAGCDEAAMKAVKETKFIPAKQRGKPLKVQVSVPILFKLSNGEESKKKN